MLTAQDVIRILQLQPHPVEGGYFRETQRTRETIPGSALPHHPGDRSAGTTIYYLLTADCVSEMHQLPGDEVFHFYLGDPLEQLQLLPDGSSRTITMGPDLLSDQVPQLVVPAGVWQGNHRLPGPHGYSLIGATMAPGFDYGDYRSGQRAELTAKWSEYAQLIEKLTPNG